MAHPPAFWGFLRLGIEHIWIGYDHLLFLLGLLIACRSFRSIIAIISSFTVAHSLTLALATLGWVRLPARTVEPAIAASIAFVGIENLLRRDGDSRERWAVAFVFGLVHGLGFANVLRNAGLGSAGYGLAWPLFSFNLGVEIGQAALAAAVLPWIWRWRRARYFEDKIVPAVSAAIVLIASYWLVERLLL